MLGVSKCLTRAGRSNLMPITVPNYNRKTDRLQFGTLIGITSES
jgi:hypothetical protein